MILKNQKRNCNKKKINKDKENQKEINSYINDLNSNFENDNLEFKDLNNYNYKKFLNKLTELNVAEIVNLYNYNNKKYGYIYNYLNSIIINSDEPFCHVNINNETNKKKKTRRIEKIISI